LPRGTVVVDSSALVEVLIRSWRGEACKAAIAGAQIVAPDLIHPETVSALRGHERGGLLTPRRAREACVDLVSMPIRRVPMVGLIDATWELRQAVSVYDAFYVALAQRLGCPLVTGDLKLARVEKLGPPILAV
jgi:predicted nucleic acid-binding protein